MYQEITFGPCHYGTLCRDTRFVLGQLTLLPSGYPALARKTLCVSNVKPWVPHQTFRLFCQRMAPVNGLYSKLLMVDSDSLDYWDKLYRRGARYVWIKREG
jgi:hypothetical protein